MPDLDSLPPLREVIAAHDLRAQKSLGQNFLLDLNMTDKIARHAGDLSGANVFEIGPGPGGLTRSLLKAGAEKVIAVEYDERAVQALGGLQEAAGDRLEIIHGDALEIDLTQLSQSPRMIVANLPYNIATPLLINWLRKIRNNPTNFQSMTLMFQKEVAQRLVAAPGNKTYGRLSVIAGWLCDVTMAFDLPATAFTPPPKVTSSVVHFVPKALAGDAPSFEAVEKITAAAFGQRRKMIRSSLKGYKAGFAALGIDETIRAEELSIEQYIQLAGS
ncbi:MAG: ribosomal RNA small subunit methyltransferase A [Micavibrio sp.]|nr:MAG: ribosomal RNA small subunit methyltransferase A [Micavibrio sp.]